MAAAPLDQLNAIGAAQHRQVFAQVVALKEAAEQVAAGARRELVEVAEALCPAWVDALSEERGIEALSLHEMRIGIITHARRRMTELEWRTLPHAAEGDRAATQVLREEVARLNADNTRLRREIATLKSQIEAQPAATIANPPPGINQEDTDPAMILLGLMAAGEGRVSVLRAQLAAALGLSSTRSTSVLRPFAELVERGLVKEVVAEGLRGQPHLIWPTPSGLDAHARQGGERVTAALVPELLKRHKTAAHTYLNLEVADLFRALGCKVNLTPAAVRSEAGRFVPDLMLLVPGGEVVFVEVEMGENGGSPARRRRKWQVNAHHTNGLIRVVCASSDVFRRVTTDIELMAATHGGRLDVGIGIYDEMSKAAADNPDIAWDDLWSHRREYGGDG